MPPWASRSQSDTSVSTRLTDSPLSSARASLSDTAFAAQTVASCFCRSASISSLSFRARSSHFRACALTVAVALPFLAFFD